MISDSRKQKIERLSLVITIVPEGLSNDVIDELRKKGITYNMALVGESGVGTGITDLLGINDDDVDIVLSCVPDSKVREVLSLISYSFDFDEAGNGGAFSVPMEGVSGPIALKYISGLDK